MSRAYADKTNGRTLNSSKLSDISGPDQGQGQCQVKAQDYGSFYTARAGFRRGREA